MITTLSSFVYGHTVTNDNRYIDFSEYDVSNAFIGTVTATLNPGDYTFYEYLDEIARAMNAVGTNYYDILVQMPGRFILIDSYDSTGVSSRKHKLLFGTGGHVGQSAASMMGYGATDTAVEHRSSNVSGPGSGSEYRPQRILSTYIAPEDWNEKVDASVNESASGLIQSIVFGDRSFMQCTITCATNKTISVNQPEIEQDLNGIQNLRNFLTYLVTKAKVVFYPDRSNENTRYTLILEKTEDSKDGTGFRLMQMKKALGFFETGVLKFRVVDSVSL